jgi:hypothetical protein
MIIDKSKSDYHGRHLCLDGMPSQSKTILVDVVCSQITLNLTKNIMTREVLPLSTNGRHILVEERSSKHAYNLTNC